MTLPVCRICLSDEPLMITPCRCKGSMGRVHVACLNQWRYAQAGRLGSFRCECCRFRYNTSTSWLGLLLEPAVITFLVFLDIALVAGYLSTLYEIERWPDVFGYPWLTRLMNGAWLFGMTAGLILYPVQVALLGDHGRVQCVALVSGGLCAIMVGHAIAYSIYRTGEFAPLLLFAVSVDTATGSNLVGLNQSVVMSAEDAETQRSVGMAASAISNGIEFAPLLVFAACAVITEFYLHTAKGYNLFRLNQSVVSTTDNE